MIFDHIRHAALYQALPGVGEALAWLSELSEEDIPDHRLELNGTRLFANPVSFTSRPACDCRFEAHRRYADIHFVREGAEAVELQLPEALTVEVPYDPAADIGFYSGPAMARCILKPGMFLVTYPEDAHKVGIAPDDHPAPVRKLVVKVQLEP